MPQVITRVCGGVGNQLFCYAAARRLAFVNKAELVIDDVSGFVRDYDYKRSYQLDHFSISCRKATLAERLEPFSRIRRYVKRLYNERLPFEKRSYIKQEGVDFDSRLLNIEPHGTLYLEGYWQSDLYFNDIEATIRSDLRIIPPTDSVNLEVAARILCSRAVAIHVRFFDVPNNHGINNITSDYYANAVNRIEALVPGAHYFIFSDRPNFARAHVPLPDERLTCVTHNNGIEGAYADLWLMSQCSHFIIANSTFSWWGAWLSANVGKVVIAPGFECRQGKMWWGFDGLFPPSWIKI